MHVRSLLNKVCQHKGFVYAITNVVVTTVWTNFSGAGARMGLVGWNS